ncbi:HAD-IA family hydrolase [Dictyobacter arantiisoli]|uniref:Haloacid dehalogenase n=1 Tax=Dictyobacter arantiisoli TaxID=2014874 RepID=A0A5A5TKJ9_9CHLR|nr:HAD-IA family hydrolase [Dictyobacter arantiisoli]GCF11802.1 haloacid dehalogenase [Dictyobacter arantiisoli]
MTKKNKDVKILTCRVVLFDLDGVLVDSIANVERHWSEWARRHQLDVTHVLSHIHGRRTIDSIPELAPALPAELEARYLNDMQTLDTRDVVAMPGAKELLNQLAPEQWAIVTSGPATLARARLRAAKLPLPRFLISGNDVTKGKPHPEGYLKGAAMMNADAEDCLIIEDTIPGVEAAHAAHIPSIAVGATYPHTEPGKADLWIPSLALLHVVDSEEDEIALAVSE